jgi:hypothetical protein
LTLRKKRAPAVCHGACRSRDAWHACHGPLLVANARKRSLRAPNPQLGGNGRTRFRRQRQDARRRGRALPRALRVARDCAGEFATRYSVTQAAGRGRRRATAVRRGEWSPQPATCFGRAFGPWAASPLSVRPPADAVRNGTRDASEAGSRHDMDPRAAAFRSGHRRRDGRSPDYGAGRWGAGCDRLSRPPTWPPPCSGTYYMFADAIADCGRRAIRRCRVVSNALWDCIRQRPRPRLTKGGT